MSQKEETKFKEKVQKDLKKLKNVWSIKTQERSRRGTPDLIICYAGIFIAIELKTDIGVIDKLQFETLKKIRASGGYAFTSCPSQWEMHYQIIKSLGEK